MTSGPNPPAAVVVTGLGAHSSFGRGAELFFARVLEGRSALAPTERGFAAPIPGGPDLVAAAREALEDAGVAADGLLRAALCLGTTTGGMASWLAGASDPAFAYHGPAARLAAALGLGGPVLVPSAACASGTAAVGLGLDLLRSGEADLVLAGGADTLTGFVQAGFAALGAVDARGPARPFDRDRGGLSLGDGAAFLVLERLASARRRPRARLLGFGMASDAVHMTAPDRQGLDAARAIAAGLADAGLLPRAIDLVSAHGTGTVYNDAMEARALQAAGLGGVPVQGIKGAIGHTLGAAGAFEALLCVRMLETGLVPPTAGLRRPDPALGLDVVLGQARPLAAARVLSTSSGFGGTNAALVLAQAEAGG